MRSLKPLTIFALFCLLLVVALAVAGCTAAARGQAGNLRHEEKAASPAISSVPEIDPYDADAYYKRGLAYQDKGQYDQAISDYSRALEIDPWDTAAYNNRGDTYENKGQYDQAISDYNRALEIDPWYALAYYNRGVAYKNKG